MSRPRCAAVASVERDQDRFETALGLFSSTKPKQNGGCKVRCRKEPKRACAAFRKAERRTLYPLMAQSEDEGVESRRHTKSPAVRWEGGGIAVSLGPSRACM